MVSTPGRILLIEDDADSAEALTLLLQLLGFETTWVRDGAGAYETLRGLRRLGAPYPDLVLLDLNLPVIDGAAVGRELVQDPRMGPIVLVSAATEQQLHQATEEMGAAGWLRKPFGADELRRALENIPRRLTVTA